MNSKTPLDKKFIRHLLIKNKPFLKSLYDSKSARQATNIIQKGDNLQINTLTRVLFLQIHDAIPLSEDDFEKIALSHQKKLLAKLKKAADAKAFIKKSLSEKKSFLVTVASSYGILLKPLFEKDYSREYETDSDEN